MDAADPFNMRRRLGQLSDETLRCVSFPKVLLSFSMPEQIRFKIKFAYLRYKESFMKIR